MITKKLDLFVSQLHLNRGECGNPKRCAIATAVREAHPDASYVSVGSGKLTVTFRKKAGESVRVHANLPPAIQRKIAKYDDGLRIAPFHASLPIIEEVHIPAITRTRQRQASAAQARFLAKRKKAGLPVPVYGRKVRKSGQIVTVGAAA